MKRKRRNKKCLGCNKTFSFMCFDTEYKGRKYCTRACSNKSTANQNSLSKRLSKNPMYKHGLYAVNSVGGTIRNKLDKIGKCQECKVKGEISPTGLIVHHIDEDRGNNSLENLLVVCRSCHYKLHFC